MDILWKATDIVITIAAVLVKNDNILSECENEQTKINSRPAFKWFTTVKEFVLS